MHTGRDQRGPVAVRGGRGGAQQRQTTTISKQINIYKHTTIQMCVYIYIYI